MGFQKNKEDYYMNKYPRKHYISDSERSDESVQMDYNTKKHGCTDILCSLLFIFFILALIAVSVFAYKNGIHQI